ncbi:unnamed protein product [Meganyctiphanes norvegica]|uniref:Threonine synthase N-terminal domain-containing protein n=1 Tax=Meganyctiphanes norvegica TaxID=48144 RepID=A0AAV2Q929_MEGNR
MIFHAFKLNILRTTQTQRWTNKSIFRTVSKWTNYPSIILMGYPGAGKTSIGKLLADRLDKPFLDIDDDLLEKEWKMPVSQKLKDIGPDKFIKLEGETLMNLSLETSSIVSLSGSNPLHLDGMNHIKKFGLVVYIDVCSNDILARLEAMKVNRIVGQTTGTPMKDLLNYRQQFYEKFYDIRILCESNESQNMICDKVITEVDRTINSNARSFVSTRSFDSNDNDAEISKNVFGDVIVKGLADDGGLYVPLQKMPIFTGGQFLRLKDHSFQLKSQIILEKLIHYKDISPQKLSKMTTNAYGTNFAQSEITPLVNLENNLYIHELFHGPTASFKDLALQLMPQLFANSMPKSSKYLILVATSGDTGSAVLDGFSRLDINDKKNIGVLVLYPKSGISDIQKLLMTTNSNDNISVIGVEGDFDFCQSSVKSIFNNSNFNSHIFSKFGVKMNSANSINWGRLIPQVVHHISAYLDLLKNEILQPGEKFDLCVPSGNFGNILSAYYAKTMGVPIKRLISASNSNNILTDFFQSNSYDLRERSLHKTMSPAIDILKSSNIERLLHAISGGDGKLVHDLYQQLEKERCFSIPKNMFESNEGDFEVGWCSENECIETIKSTLHKNKYLLDPHTSVGVHVAKLFNNNERPMVVSSTAHYSKFPDAVLKALGHDTDMDINDQLNVLKNMGGKPSMHQALLYQANQPEVHNDICNGSLDEIQNKIEDFCIKKFT